MNKKFIVALSKLLKIDESVINEALVKEDGDDSIINDFVKNYASFTKEELATLIKNNNKQYLEGADFDIKEVPTNLYRKIAAAALESKEKKKAEEYKIEKYDGFEDLIDKIAESKATGKGTDEGMKQQIETLKQAVLSKDKEKEEAVSKVREEYESEFINRDFESALNNLSQTLDYEKDVLPKQSNLLKSAFKGELKLSRKGNVTTVLDAEGKLKMNNLGEPLPVFDVLKNYAAENGFKFKHPEEGGRGTASSTETNNALKGKSFAEVLSIKGVKPLTDESDALMKEHKQANPEMYKI